MDVFSSLQVIGFKISGEIPERHVYLGGPMEVIVTIVRKLGYFTYLGDEINLLILGL